MTHKFFRLALITALISVLVGTVSAQDDRVNIVWYVGLGTGGSPEQIPTQEAVVEAFNESQDSITLELVVVDNTVAYDTLSTLIATGEAPDIVGPVGNDGSNAYAGQYLDLEPLIESTGYDLSQFDEAAVDSFRTEDGLVGLPFATFPSFIYYRRDLFDDAGVDYPPSAYGETYNFMGEEREWNMDTLRDLAIFMTVDSEGFAADEEEFNPDETVQWGFASQWNEPRGHASMFGAANPIDDDGNAVIPDEWRTAFNWFYNGIWTDHFIPSAQEGGSDLLAAGNAFQSGNVAMAHTHLWYAANAGDPTWDIAPMPSFEGTTTAKLHGDTFRIMESTENPEAAFEVLTYLVGEASLDLLRVYGGMPARAEDTDAFFETLEEDYPQEVNWQIALDSLAYADSPSHESNLPNYLRAKDAIANFQADYESNPDLDIQARLDELGEELNEIYSSVE